MRPVKASDPRVRFGKAVRKRRLAAGLSQEELAGRAGIHRNYAGEIARGQRNIAILNMTRLARALNVSLASLMREADL